MKNLNPYEENAFAFHKKVIESKRNSKEDPEYISKVSSYNDDIETQYISFEEKFKVNQLEDLSCFGYSDSDKETLLKLYSFKSKIIQHLKVKMTTDEQNRLINTCQNCTVSEVNSFDHVIPKDEFSEFIVNPKNLFPSCTKCNSYKNTAWRNDNGRMFLNLYLDTLPNEQYLFVDIKLDENEIDINYYLENSNSINSELFDLIESHYNKLHLFQRFKENSDVVMSELENSIKAFQVLLSLKDIKATIIEECEASRRVLGYNYWKIILKLSLIENEDFLKRFEI